MSRARFAVGRPTSPASRDSGALDEGHGHGPASRDSGALDEGSTVGGDVLVETIAQQGAELAKRRSVARGVAMLGAVGAGRDAGDVRAGTASGVPPGVDADDWWAKTPAERDQYFEGAGSATFDPSDPAAMTASRWAAMPVSERRAWIDANVRETEARNRMIAGIATGVFDTIRDFVRTERETRLLEIRETNATQREANRNVLEGERQRLAAETDRQRILAETARAEADRAASAAALATTEATRVARQAEADAARERAAVAQAAADSAARDRAAAESQLAREASLARLQADSASGLSPAVMAVGGGVVLLFLAGLGWVVMNSNKPPQYPPQYPPQFGAPQYGAGQ